MGDAPTTPPPAPAIDAARAAPEDHVPRPLRVAAAWSWRLLLVVVAAAAVGVLLLRLSAVLLPGLLALFIAAALEPLAAALRRHGWRPGAAATAVVVGFVAVIAAVSWWLGVAVASQFDDLGRELERSVDDVKGWMVDGPLGMEDRRVDEIERDIRRSFSFAGGGGLAERVVGPVRFAIELLAGIGLMFFTLFFVLKDGERIGTWLLSRTPAAYRVDVSAAASRARFVMQRYLVATAATGLVDAALVAIALVVVGVPAVIPLAFLTFIGAFVPIVGATVAGGVSALVALANGGLVDALVIVGATIVIQQVEGNVLQPLFFERIVRLHALVTIWAVAAGIVLGGLVGAFLAVPIVATVTQITHFYRVRSDPLVT